MRKSFTLLFLLFLPLLAWAQSVVVPKNIYFADIQLKISDEAQQEIQKKVDALHKHPASFKRKVELADAYFPLIERTFREYGVPEDLKYLAIQESGLIGDAVSTSNAVGYWQFKREAATDFNLRVNSQVDERKHIIEASRGAALYFIRSNNHYNNWFNSILSFYLGYSGAKAYTSPSDNGSKKMDVTEKTNPYLLTFLAHKIAYEPFVSKTPAISIKELRASPGQSLAEIALEHQTDRSELEKYNKWLLGNTIPSDKEYLVMVPVRFSDKNQVILASKDETAIPTHTTPVQNRAAKIVKHNGLNALIARSGDTKDVLALQAGISTRKFLNYNDMHNFDEIVEGHTYYIEAKHRSASTEFHVVQPGETTQQISQMHGIRLTQLLFKNRMARNEVPVPGRVIWLQNRRPFKTPIEVKDLKGKSTTVATKTSQNSTTTEVKSNVAPVNASAETATEPKDNIFKRFIRSFDRFKKQPAEEVSADEVVKEQPVIVKIQKEQQVDTAILETETEDATEATEALKAQKKAREEALYPGKKPVPAIQKEQQQPAKKEEVEAKAVDAVEAEVEKEEIDEVQVKAPAATPHPAAKQTHHVVKQGETLYSISRLYATTVNDVVNWNNLGDAPIKVGQELLIAEPLKTPVKSSVQVVESQSATANNNFHIVEAGETLYQISKKYNVSLEDLQDWNNLIGNSIAISQKLRITAPAGEPAQVETAPARSGTKSGASSVGEQTYHTVAAGESMYQISRKYDVTIKDIMQWNNKSDFNVSMGEKLLIKKK